MQEKELPTTLFLKKKLKIDVPSQKIKKTECLCFNLPKCINFGEALPNNLAQCLRFLLVLQSRVMVYINDNSERTKFHPIVI